MNRLSKTILIPAIMLLTLLVIAATLNLTQQANAIDTGTHRTLPTSVAYPPDSLLQRPLPCYGPEIVANISKTQVNLGESVTVTGRICPPQSNFTIRVTFTRPDYTWIDDWVLTDNVTGEFSATQTLDMAGFWNIFPIYGHLSDRLYANVTDAANPLAPLPTIRPLPPFKTNYNVLAVAAISVSVGLVTFAGGLRNKTRKVSSLRFFVQIAFVFILFFGVFIDHQNLPVPAEQIAPHEVLIGVNSLGPLPDGLPVPALACYYPCGRVVTCPLWQIQTYIYPFWNTGRGWGVNYDLSGFERISIIFGILIVASVLLGRFWCGWICPFGLYIDLMSRLRKALRIKHRNFSPSFNTKFHQMAYVIVALMLILSVLFGSQAIAGAQLVPGTQQGGLVYTYFSAPFCQVCPMKPLCVLAETSVGLMQPNWIFGPTTGQFWQLGQYVTSLNLFILIIVTAAAFFFRRSWCRICPLGGLIGLFSRFPPFKWASGMRLEKDEEKCTRCGICKRVCPTQVTEVFEERGGDVTTSQCILCLRCVEMCPYGDTLKFKVAGKTAFRSRNWLDSNSYETGAGID